MSTMTKYTFLAAELGSAWDELAVKGTGIRVSTLVLAVRNDGRTPEQVASDFGVPVDAVLEAIDYVDSHAQELERRPEPQGATMKTARLQNTQHEALRAFQRDLPELWIKRPGEWVAYQGDRLLGFAAQKHELYQQCFQQGLERQEFVVFCIEPQETEMTLGPVRA